MPVALYVSQGTSTALEGIGADGGQQSDRALLRVDLVAERFMRDVDASAVYWNASTRFTDGAEFGMGAEIGISTDKVGARGPMGLDELTSYKWRCYGKGQIR